MPALVAIAAIAAALVAAGAGCDASSRGARPRRDPGALVVAQAADVLALDLARVTDNESIEVCGLLFEGLVRWKPGTTDTEAGLATAWEVSPDGKRWTFHLRPGVQFHDGAVLDAEAVVFSFARLLDPHHPNYLAEGASYWRGQLKVVTDVVAVDPATVAIHVARPYAPLLGDLALFPIVSPRAVARWGDDFKQHPVGTGPFAFASWTPGEQVVVRRFDGYWGKPALLDKVVFRVVVDARQRLVDLESGSVDLAKAILPDEQSFVALHPDLELHHTQGNDVSYLAFNVARAPFDRLAVRRAINKGINKEPIVKLAYQGRAAPADGPLPPTQWGYHKPRMQYAFDAAAAKRELAAQKLDPATVYKFYAPSTPRPYMAQPERVARFLQAALDQIGVRTDLVLQPYTEHRASVQRGEHDLALFGWIGDTGDPDNFLYVLFHSDNTVEGKAQNISFYRDETLDKLLVDAQGTADVPARTAMYGVVQDRIADMAPWVPVAHSEPVVAGRTELRDVVLSPLGHPVYALIRRREAP
ncbi:MAG: ABC transporter substrate-binding protein [Deltaproteobacteria bacterium]|nr:ABC transporter substrate-binding protein [Deltaproteobacteria bacterium]